MTQAELNIGWRGGMAPDGADRGRDRDGGIAFGDEYMLPAAAGSLRSRPPLVPSVPPSPPALLVGQ